MKKILLIITILLLTCQNSISYAAETEDEYTVYDKFSRGIFNTITSPFELPIAVYEVSTEENILMGVLYGVPLGAAKSLLRFAIGMVEMATFPFPPYEPMLDPGCLIIDNGETE